MKKFKIYVIQAFILLALMPGCTDFVDLEPRDQLSMDIALTSLENLEGAILAVYERGRFTYQDFEVCFYKLLYTDIVRAGACLGEQPVWNALATFEGFDATNTGLKTVWDGYYAGLNRANTIIEKIDVVEYNRENPGEVQRRNTVLGEALFFRAYYHLSLIQYWDNIILADQVFDDPSQDYELASKTDVYALIVADLEEAINLLPEASDVISRGKISKGVARHLLSLTHLDLENWVEAAALAEDVIDDPAYGFAPMDQIFSENYEENSEIILSWQFIPGGNGQWTAVNLTPMYDRCNGVTRTFEQGGRPWSRLSPTEYYWTLFEEDDLRLEAWHRRYWVYDSEVAEDPLPEGVEIGDTVTAENIDETAGYGIRAIEPTTTKYWEGDGLGRVTDDAGSWKNVIQFRYSEAFLVAAEAYMNSGNLSRGQELFDQLRARAGKDPIDLNLNNLLDEQARELGFEGRRYPMLKRLGILQERIQMGSPDIGANMLPHHIRWPLPQIFVDLTGVPQNEGYE